MTLREKSEANMLVGFFVGMFMLAVGFFSFMFYMDYLDTGEMTSEIIYFPCLLFGTVVLLTLWFFNFPVVRVVLNAAPQNGRRAAYFQALFPLVLIAFMLATPRASFAPSVTFAFPLLLLGAIGYPYSGMVLHKWVKMSEMKNLQVVECFRCTYVFEMHVEELWIRCPYCGQVNMNPERGLPSEEGADEAPAGGPLSP
jgi:hypothetical protein